MDYDNSIIVTGDIHGDWSALNKLINHKKPKIVLQTGDFGYFPRLIEIRQHGIISLIERNKVNDPLLLKQRKYPKLPQGSKLYFCDGNHEDHESLGLATSNEVYPNVFHMKRGSTITLPDGRIVLFMGGAESLDKDSRIQGRDWFPEEEIKDSDIRNLDLNRKIDIVISHTCPMEFDVYDFGGKERDSSRLALSYILEIFRPSLWYFGHWHIYKTGFVKNCRWTVLDMTWGSSGKWWEYLKK